MAEAKHDLTCKQGGQDRPYEKEPDVEVVLGRTHPQMTKVFL